MILRDEALPLAQRLAMHAFEHDDGRQDPARWIEAMREQPDEEVPSPQPRQRLRHRAERRRRREQRATEHEHGHALEHGLEPEQQQRQRERSAARESPEDRGDPGPSGDLKADRRLLASSTDDARTELPEIANGDSNRQDADGGGGEEVVDVGEAWDEGPGEPLAEEAD